MQGREGEKKHNVNPKPTCICTRYAKFGPGGPAEPQNSSPAGLSAEPEQSVPGLCRAWGKRPQCIMHWPSGCVRYLKGACRVRCWAQQISCGAGLGSGSDFTEMFASLICTYYRMADASTKHFQSIINIPVNNTPHWYKAVHLQ